MSEAKNKPGWLFWLTMGFTVLLVTTSAYVGVYWWAVRPKSPEFGPGVHLEGDVTIYMQPQYSSDHLLFPGKLPFDQRLLERVFEPVHWIDRKLRPDEWEIKVTYGPNNQIQF